MIYDGDQPMVVVKTLPTTLALRAKLFHGLADFSRLSILEALRDGATGVTEIVAATGLSQPNVANHLRCLRDCGLVTSEQVGSFVYYQLSDARVAQLLSLADEVLVDVAIGVEVCPRYTLAEEGRDG